MLYKNIFLLPLIMLSGCSQSKKSDNPIQQLLATQPRPSSLAPIKKRTDNYALYAAYPTLEQQIPSLQLCELPTPAYKLEKASQALNIDLSIKRDDLTNSVYGGNKNRTLEFFLADAQRIHAPAVVTVGSAGSTHAVATAHMARTAGFKTCYTELVPHPNSYDVRDILLLLQQYGATLQFYPDATGQEQGVINLLNQYKKEHGMFPYFIPAGGSAPLGIIGYVSAMFELKQQIEKGLLPEPDYLYVACGTKGTSAGLLLGAKAAGLKTTVIPVCIKPSGPDATYAESICELSIKTRDLIRSAVPEFPNVSITPSDLPLIHDCSGVEYGVFTPQGVNAKEFLWSTEDIVLDGTYTAKAFGKLIEDAQHGILKGKKVLFWLTFCSEAKITNHDYKTLPEAAQRYFTEPVQPLDKKEESV